MVGAGQSVRFEDAEAIAADIDSGRDAALADGVTIEVLPPFAGGSR